MFVLNILIGILVISLFMTVIGKAVQNSMSDLEKETEKWNKKHQEP